MLYSIHCKHVIYLKSTSSLGTPIPFSQIRYGIWILYKQVSFYVLKSRTFTSSITCPVHKPTTKSAIKVSSVSPDRWLTITPQPFCWAILHLRRATRFSLNSTWMMQFQQFMILFSLFSLSSSLLSSLHFKVYQ